MSGGASSVGKSARMEYRTRVSGLVMQIELEGGQFGEFDLPLPVARDFHASMAVALHQSEIGAKGLLPVSERTG